MKHLVGGFIGSLVVISAAFLAPVTLQAESIDSEAQACIDCHTNTTPAMVTDWRNSKHALRNVSCASCHVVDSDSPMGMPHPGTNKKVSVLVPPSVCGQCHAAEVEQFNASGHFRAYRQQIPKEPGQTPA